jgi:hypothetical protein
MVAGAGTNSTLRCGLGNTAVGDESFVVGACNTASGSYPNFGYRASVTGGFRNTASATYSHVSGGMCNTTSNGPSSSISGGYGNTISSAYGDDFIGAGFCNSISGSYVGFSAIVSGQLNKICGTSSKCNVIGGGYANVINASGGANIVGGYENCIVSSTNSFIGGGRSNTISAAYPSFTTYGGILAGCNNRICHESSFIIGSSLTSSAACQTKTNALSKASGTFEISHPDPAKNATKYLSHSFVESPTRGDNIYRYKICTINCQASLALPDYYKFLNENDQVWVSPVCHFGSAYGVVDPSQTCVNFTSNCDGDYNVLVIGTRKDIDAMKGWRGVETWK